MMPSGPGLSERELFDVEPLPQGWPERLRVTMLKRANVCPYSAYLYVKHDGGHVTHRMDGGAAFHATAEVCTNELIERGDDDGEGVPPDVAKATLEALILEHPEWVIPLADRVRLRKAVWQWAEFGHPLPPENIVAVERRFVLPVLNGRRLISGRIDVALLDGPELTVRDYKTSPHAPTQDEFEQSVQTPIYALLARFGRAAREVPCARCEGTGRVSGWTLTPIRTHSPDYCPDCKGRGWQLELAPFGLAEQASQVRVAEHYPAPELDARKTVHGMVVERARLFDLSELHELREEVEGMVAKLESYAEQWAFPARRGTWCGECPAREECPIKPKIAPEIVDESTAREAALAWLLFSEEARKIKADIKAFASREELAEVRVGEDGDLVLAFSAQESQSVSDWDGLAQAIVDATELGRPFDRSRFVSVRSSTRFDKRKLAPAELAALNGKEHDG